MVIRAKPGCILPRFLYHFLTSRRITDWLQHLAESRSGTFPQITFDQVAALELHLPSEKEQERIVSFLDALNDKIDQNRRTAAALEVLALAMFRAWFVDFEPVKAKVAGDSAFPSMPQSAFEFLPVNFVDSEIGLIPDGWLPRSLYSTARFINGAAFRSEHFCNPSEGLPVVKIVELKSGITSQTKFSARTDLDLKYQIDTGDILYSWSGSPDTSLDTFVWTKGPGLLNQHIFRVVNETEEKKYFVYYLLKHLRQRLIEIARNKQTTGLGHVTVADMKRVLICWPDSNLLTAFSNQAGPMFQLAFRLMFDSERLSELRDYLLPRLVAGEIRAGVNHV